MNQVTTTLDGTTTPAAFSPAISGVGTAGQKVFDGQIDLPTPSILTVTYQATIADEASGVIVENELKAQADLLGGNSGSFSYTLTNTAKFGPTEVAATADVLLRGTIPGPCTTGCSGAAFNKSGTGASVNVIADDNGVIVTEAGVPTPIDVTYTLGANLSQWDGHNDNYTLDRNALRDF